MLKALNDNIIVKPLNSEAMTAGGIIIPDTAREKAREGIVAAVGPGHVTGSGRFIPTELKEGMKIIFPHHCGNEVKFDGVEYLVMREEQILGIFEAEEL